MPLPSFQFKIAAIKCHHFIDVRNSDLLHGFAIILPNIDRFLAIFLMDARITFGVSLIVHSGNPSVVLRKLPSLSNPTPRSTIGLSSLANGFGISLTFTLPLAFL